MTKNTLYEKYGFGVPSEPSQDERIAAGVMAEIREERPARLYLSVDRWRALNNWMDEAEVFRRTTPDGGLLIGVTSVYGREIDT